MICDPAIVELMGFESEDDYPFPVGSSAVAPERIYCEGDEPVITPHGVFHAVSAEHDVTLSTPALELVGPSLYARRFWYAPRADNQAAAINLENDSSYPMSAMVFVVANQTVTWLLADANPECDEGWIAKHGVTVMETVIGGTPLAPYSSAYGAPFSSPVTPTLETTFSWDATWDKTETLNAYAFGLLPQLAPGSAYRAEPFMFIKSRVLHLHATAPSGNYDDGRMFFGMVGWSDTS